MESDRSKVWGLSNLWEGLRTEEYLNMEEVSKAWKYLEGLAQTYRESERTS